jgi:hypothetical protein
MVSLEVAYDAGHFRTDGGLVLDAYKYVKQWEVT